MKNTYKKFLSAIMILLSQVSLASKFDTNIRVIGKLSLELAKGFEVSIVQFEKGEDEYHKFWKTKLVVKENNKVIIEKFPIISDEGENNFFYLVPIQNGKYIMDLDQDKDYEFAVAHDHRGNAPSTTAMVFSLKGSELQVYKKAWYQMEGGSEVIWRSEKAPTKCLFFSQGLCEYL